jgi:amino acid adenylation domain-containing protein
MIENVYPLSPLQEGIYYHWLLDPQSSMYVDQLIYTTQGGMDIDKMRQGYHKLVNRHAILRTFFTQEVGEKALQVVLKNVPDAFAYHDCTNPDGPTAETLVKEDLAKGFNLQSGSQMRLTVLKLAEEVYQFIWTFHHILLDGWCITILIREFYEFYKSLLMGTEPAMGPVYPYVNYIKWLEKINQAECIDYWKSYLEEYDTPAVLPKLPNTEGRYELKETHVLLPPEHREAMRKLCAELGITENVFFQTVWGIVLGKYNNTNDVVFGAVVSGRPPEVEGVENMIGLFINTVPVRIKATETMTVRSLLRKVQDDAIHSSRYHYTQLANIQAETGAGTNLVDHILVFENYPVQNLIEQGMEQQQQGDSKDIMLVGLTSVEQTNYAFNIIVMPGEHFYIRFNHNTFEYSETHIDLIQRQLLGVIGLVLQNPDRLVTDMDCLSPTEREQLLVGFNNTKVEYPVDKTVVQLFEEQVEITPHRIALAFGETELTYQQLNEATNQVAHYLREAYTLAENDIVGIHLPRSHWQVLAILSVLKAGGAYLPLDTDFPPERVANMVADCQCKVVINEMALQQFLPIVAAQSITNPTHLARPDSLMYVMYTSGSTGVPKGVQVPHRAAVRLVKHTNYAQLNESTVLLSTGAVAFDATTFEYWGALLNGGKLVISTNDVLLDEEQMGNLMKQQGVNTIFLTTGWFNQLVERNLGMFDGLEILLTGGERVSTTHIRMVRERYPKLQIMHVYGPTENTTFSTAFEVKEVGEETIPIGKPIHNSTAYIINAQGHLAPVGIEGEIYVGGDGLALGYLNQPGLTDEKFVSHPFVPGERLYRTGDMGRWLPDGNIVFMGRRDEQVKIRGYRIELGEIEAKLRTYPGIEDAIVIVREDNRGEKELVAYVVSKETITDATAIGIFLGSVLPPYMVPAYFVPLPVLPLNKNGKVDRKQLPNPEGGLGLGAQVEFVAPRTETEARLLKLWQEILGKEKIGVKDNFFAIGGHSLKATKMISHIRKEFNVNLSLPVLFGNPTIEHIANEIDKTNWVNAEQENIGEVENISI